MSGKSIAATNQLVYSFNKGLDVLGINLELSQSEYEARVYSKLLGKPIDWINENPEEVNKLKEVYLDKPNSFEIVSVPLDADQIINLIREKAVLGLDLVVIDYLQIVKNNSHFKSFEFIAEFVKDLQRLTLELGIVILTPIQINQEEVDDKGDNIKLSTRGSKELEFSCSRWLHIFQTPENYKDNIAMLIDIKARHGKKHKYMVETDFKNMQFKDLEVIL